MEKNEKNTLFVGWEEQKKNILKKNMQMKIKDGFEPYWHQRKNPR